jgi:hypothetical protein
LGILENETEIWEDGMRTHGGEGTFEWWYTDAEFEDGTTVVATFYSKNDFDLVGKAHPKARIEVTYPDGTFIKRVVYEEEGTTIDASTDYCDVKIGNTSLKYVDGDYILSFEDENLKYDAVIVERGDTIQHEVTGKFMDNHLTFTNSGDDGIVYTVEYKRHEDILAVHLLSNPKRLIAKLLGANPTYVRVLGDVVITIDDNNGEKTVLESEGLWEQMHFGTNKSATIGD